VSVLSRRASGVLCHPTSLPGPYGIGDLGPEARAFATALATAGQRWWQMLPIGPPKQAQSPYDAASTFAGNPLLLSLDDLVEDGLLSSEEVGSARIAPQSRANFEHARTRKAELLRRAAERASPATPEPESWLGDYCLFLALHAAHGGLPWTEWSAPLRDRDPAALAESRRALAEEIAYHAFVEQVFERQWQRLRAHCHAAGVWLMGDVPIFVALDSADVWAHRDIFQLDGAGRPRAVAGVPPDYFNEDGQLWGNPLYDWDRLRETSYSWWVERVRALLERFDAARLDHFIGFHHYWAVPAGAKTAREGRWTPGPGRALFERLFEALGDAPLIAEDLGQLTPEVSALRDGVGLYGMRVLQFAFTTGIPDNIHLPHQYGPNCVAYTGTHDNDTSVGWFRSLADERERRWALEYLSADPAEIHWAMIRGAWASPATIAFTPLQDVLGLDGAHRMNRPGIAEGNWGFRASETLGGELCARLRALTEAHGRAS